MVDGDPSDEERRAQIRAFCGASREMQQEIRRNEAVRVGVRLGDDPVAEKLDDATAAGDGEAVRELLDEREAHRAAQRARVRVADAELHRARLRHAIRTATRPVAVVAPRRRTPSSGQVRPAGRSARRPTATRAGPDSDDGPAEPAPPRPSLAARLRAAVRAFRAGGAR
jgi:hypothetical protein